jgi:hypothetical protein
VKQANQLVIIATATVIGGAAVGLSGCIGHGASTRARTTAQIPAPQVTDATCTDLASLKLDQVEIQSAVVQPANAVVEGARRPDMTGEPHGVPVSGLPAFCRVTGAIHPEAGSNIRFEVWMPMQHWNGRYFGANNGGFAGSLRYDDLAAAVLNGGAGASTDSGHSSADRTWARGRPERVRDYGWRSTHLTAVTAKDIIDRFYRRRPDHSYFVGCSNGGRQALIEAGRFPEDYDGIVAGAPVDSWTETAMNSLNVYRAQKPPGAAIRPEQAQLLQSEVIRQCDALDGQVDGLVVNPLKCNFDHSKLACGSNTSPLCFTPPQITALRQIQAGPHDSAGHRVAYGFVLGGAEVGQGNVGWDGSILSSRGSMISALQDLTATPLASADAFDFDTDPARLKAALAADLDPQPDLRRFFDRGGKLIMWHGWGDSILQPEATVAFYQAVLQRSGRRASGSLRLFMIPGIQHCSGGPGADAFGGIGAAPPDATPERNIAAAVTSWVEDGRTPESIIGRHGQAEIAAGKTPSGAPMERLHCAYPTEPALRPGADPNSGSSYACKRVR